MTIFQRVHMPSLDDPAREDQARPSAILGYARTLYHRPLPSVLLWSRLMGEHFAGTPYAQYFLSDAAP